MITTASHKKVRLAIIVSSILKEPFVCFYLLLPFFLLRDLGAHHSHIVFYTMIQPVSSLFSFYVSELLSRQGVTLKTAMLVAGLMARLCFIPALIFNNVYLYLFGSAMYMIFKRAESPAWMEAIKINVFREKWEKTFSMGSILGYLVGALLTLFYVSLIDDNLMAWKVSFAVSLGLGMMGVLFQASMIDNDNQLEIEAQGMKQKIVAPVKGAFSLLKAEPDFARFLWSFMIGGLGLMIIQPVIPLYFTEVLNISYSDLMVSFCVCKALGFVLTTPTWNYCLKNLSIKLYISMVLTGFGLYSALLVFSSVSINAIYLAYLLFGISQAGSQLVWYLSGPIFSKERSSTQFTALNVVMVGFRGCIGPVLGWLLLYVLDPISVFMISMLLCFSGTLLYLQRRSKALAS